MNSPTVLAPRAERELRDALLDIAQHNLAAAQALNVAVALAMRRLGTHPSLGSTRPYLPNRFRAWVLPRYRCLLIYDGSQDPVQVLRMVHMARDLPRALADLQDLPEPPA